ncbi:DUF4157 domain-containing protein (plasmid) [Kovacikia minuta CCNUW1]|uniref:eCIS core domain-containing protein n=1 Tax=Kovacikia minuta TaxID=2931930 RepID=UPI001CC9EBDD|nr:DUF4157 domain-containing protein [Kovacikia minuta]UBF30544.1 DUF4157 domain-containing protein [Kovacikia minuta CCNUW1]
MTMGSKSHTQTTSAKSSDTAHLQNQVALRPFAAQAETASVEQQELPDVQTQLETAKQFGHRFTGTANSESNAATTRSPASLIQPKLTIGAPGDKYEQEADRVAAQVVSQIQASKLQPSEQAQNVQRSSAPEEEELQMLLDISRIQRSSALEEEELQMSSIVQRSLGGETAAPDIESAIAQAGSSGQPLDNSIRQPMEQSFKADFSGVRVHTDAQADGLNRSLLSRAFTTNQDIFFKRGEYQPNSKNGQELLAHELTHVVQQNSATVQRKGTNIQRQGTNDLQISQVTAPLSVVQRDYYLWADQGLNVTYNIEEKFQGVVTTGAGPCVAVAFDATYKDQRALSLAHFDESTIESTTLPKMYQSLIKALKIDDINSVSDSAIQITYHLGGGVTGYLKKLVPIISDFLKGQKPVSPVQGSLYDSQESPNTAFKLDKDKGFGKAKGSFKLEEEKFGSTPAHLELMYMVHDSVEMYKALLASLEKSEFLDVEQDGGIDYGAQHYKELENQVAVAKKMKEDPKTAIEVLEEYVKNLKGDEKKLQERIGKTAIKKGDSEVEKTKKQKDKEKFKKNLEELKLKIENVNKAIASEKQKLELVKSD